MHESIKHYSYFCNKNEINSTPPSVARFYNLLLYPRNDKMHLTEIITLYLAKHNIQNTTCLINTQFNEDEIIGAVKRHFNVVNIYRDMTWQYILSVQHEFIGVFKKTNTGIRYSGNPSFIAAFDNLLNPS